MLALQAGTQAEVPTWLSALCAIVFFGTLGAVAFVLSQRRRRGLEALAAELGFEYHEFGESRLKVPDAFSLMRDEPLGSEGSIRRSLEGEIDGVQVLLFEMMRIDDPNKGTTRGYPQSVAMFVIPGLNLPDFRLSTERWYHRLPHIGAEDIDFPESREFSRRFRLQGADADAIRALFTPRLRDLLMRRSGLQVEAVNGCLLVHRPTRMLRLAGFRPAKVRALLNESLPVADALRGERGQRCPPGRPARH